MLLEIRDGSVSLRGESVLSHFDFCIRGREHIALVGANGAGKTTLLRALAGELEIECNEKNPASAVRWSRKIPVGLLRQFPEEDPDMTVEEWIRLDEASEDPESREAYTARVEYTRVFTAFGFCAEDARKKIAAFSGGERAKISLVRLLVSKPELLLLDEPTNHLDVETVEWLEEYIRAYPGAVVAVSHDRFFLDRIAGAVVEAEGGRLYRYAGNYTAYREEKRALLERQTRAWERQQQEIRREKELIERFKQRPRKAAFARSRKKLLERMEPVEKPREEKVRLVKGDILPASGCSKWPLEAEDLAIGYDHPLKVLNFRLRRGQKTGIIGANGTGKTTFLRTLAGELPGISGKLSVGNGVEMAYFGQNAAELTGEMNVLEWFRERFPSLTEQEARSVLGGYLFSGRDAAKPVDGLSGGEKARLVLAALLQERPNLLLLDEPTNHMDIPARETLESIFRAYKGTILFVSHDRYFTDRVADSLMIFGEEGEPVRWYPFGYRHYLERKRAAGKEADMDRVRTEQEQAMIEGLRAVPGKERHRLRELPEEELRNDWLSEVKERKMQEAEEVFAQRFLQMQEQSLQEEAGGLTEIHRLLAEAEDAWTGACLEWYEAVLPALEKGGFSV